MYKDPNRSSSPVCNFIPSYSSYDGIGGSLAGGLSNLVELVIRLFSGLRR
jgi:hypothetical protein